MSVMRSVRPIAAALLPIVFLSCGGDISPPKPTTPPATPASITVSPPSVALASGSSISLTATVRDQNGAAMTGVTVSWTSSDPSVATISSQGVIVAARAGQSTVTAQTGSISAQIAVTVVPGPASALALRTQPAGAAAGVPLTIQPVVEVRDAAGNLVTSAAAVTATISTGGGTITGATATAVSGVATFSGLSIGGTVGQRALTFTASGLNGITSAPFTLTYGPVETVTLSPASITLAPGDTMRLTATLKDAYGNDAAGTPIVWSVTDTRIATVTSAGRVSAVAVGSTTVAATAGGKTASRSVTVQPGSPVASTQVSPGITSTFIRLFGVLDPKGAASMVWFNYGTSPTLATFTETGHFGPFSTATGVGQDILGLAPSTAYYYRLIAENSVGRTTGSIVTMTTSPATGTTLFSQLSLSGATGDSYRASFTVPAGTTRLEIAATGTTGNFDLYTRFNAAAETNLFNCASNFTPSVREVCTIDNPQAGTWHVLLYGVAAYSGATLTAIGYGTTPAPPPPTPSTFTLTVTTAGTGSGTVRSSPTGPSYSAGTNVTLTATADAGSTFSGWSGACTSTSSTCSVTMDANKSVTATFTRSGGGGGVTTFDGSYVGRYTGRLGGSTVSDVVIFSVSNGVITVREPVAGTGTVNASGSATFAGSLPGTDCSFTGAFTSQSSTIVNASGTWTCSGSGGGSGTWSALRENPTGAFIPNGVWLYMSWSSAATGTPLDRQSTSDPSLTTGSYCLPQDLTFTRRFNNGVSGVYVSVLCNPAPVIYACVGKGSDPQPPGELQQCTVDPLNTPISQLHREALVFTGPGVVDIIYETSAVLDLKVFYCKAGTILVTPPRSLRLFCA
jgi:hypothetical protein